MDKVVQKPQDNQKAGTLHLASLLRGAAAAAIVSSAVALSVFAQEQRGVAVYENNNVGFGFQLRTRVATWVPASEEERGFFISQKVFTPVKDLPERIELYDGEPVISFSSSSIPRGVPGHIRIRYGQPTFEAEADATTKEEYERGQAREVENTEGLFEFALLTSPIWVSAAALAFLGSRVEWSKSSGSGASGRDGGGGRLNETYSLDERAMEAQRQRDDVSRGNQEIYDRGRQEVENQRAADRAAFDKSYERDRNA